MVFSFSLENMTCDAEIKLFGKILPVVVPVADDSVTGTDESNSGFDTDLCLEDNNTTSAENDEANEGIESSDYEKQEAEKDDKTEELSEQKLEEDQDQDRIMDESENPLTSSDLENGSITPTGEDLQTVKLSETENEPNNVTDSQQKQLKKPDKILPCPRCSSMDTKFCYYNNNNVNQPRHFCRSCQRYWTAGGTMRNIPVGAGRRKNKSFASHYRHINIPEGLLAAGVESPNGYHNPVFKPNCTVLSFGPDLAQREFTAPALNQAEKSLPNVIQHVFHQSEHKSSPCKGVDNADEGYRAPSVMTSKAVVEDGKNEQHKEAMNNTNGFPSPVPFFHGVPWPIPWNAAVPFGPFGFPIPFCPAPYWNCSVPPWSVPWLSPPSQAANEKALGPDPNSHLGKHSREGDLLNRKNPDGNETSEQKSSERSILIPKTLRIDDPDEAAKSSIWSTLGIKYDSASRGGFFKALQPKSDDKDNKTNASPVLHANPAALSRLVSLQERA